MTEGLYKTPDVQDPARQAVCPKCQAAIGAACTEPSKPFGMKFVDYYHPERTEAAHGAA